MRYRWMTAALAGLALLVPATTAHARAASHLWATVNVCDTKNAPDTLGVRARMPGNGTHQRMWMRFRVQYLSTQTSKWAYVTQGGLSPWIEAGSAKFAFKETGYEFSFDPPAEGATFTLRGVVEYQWRAKHHDKNGKIVTTVAQRKRKFTEAGHRTKDADPAAFSAKTCEIKP
jgi:hypothetical protein